MRYLFVFLFITFLLTGCNSIQPKPEEKAVIPSPISLANPTLFELQPVPNEQDIFSLPDAEQKKFIEKFNSSISQGKRADKIIADYLEYSVSNFTYDGKTFTATEAYKQKYGNCVSLAILTQAYANLAGLETSFREVSTYPIFKKEKDLVLVSTHFNTKLFAPKEEPEDKNWIQILRAGTVVDYFPEQSTIYLGNAKYPSLVAKFYANLATEALLKEDFNLSYSFTKEAFKFTPRNPELINLLAILHRRAGDTDTAKKLFEFALKHEMVSSNLIASYKYLADKLGDKKLELRLESELEKSAKTPFDYLQVAIKATKKEQFSKAKRILNAIIKHYPYLPEPHFELAKVHYLQNRHDLAKIALEEAIKMSDSQEKTGMYEAKLKSLELTL
ncbi:tetratricopeptide repeat protein [Pseudoalteromonas sp. MTN2-4]|uniref:tetratricopeptide repeat protein n=1 Tax=Pseudoalteromonas sp. MTN2-4 TaxID=3056555 RepID=UPI0036F275B2